MPAIITDRFKKELLLLLSADLADSASNYYVGVGRSYDWDSADEAPNPRNTGRDIRNAQLSEISVKNVEAYSFVVPRYDWTSGAVFNGYNDNTIGHPTNSYYVITEENQVYVCLEQGKNAQGQAVTSTVKPTGTSDNPFETADGYRWKFLYSIGALKSANFLSANFMPVTKIDLVDSDSPADEVEQKGVQDAATPGQITGYTVIAGGTGYTTVPTLTVRGNGSGAKAAATISGGTITKVTVVDSDGSLAHGTNYSEASVVVSGGGGTGAVIRPILGPAAGFGADPRDDLRATAIMLTAKPDGTESGNWVIGNDFRQVVLIKNPKTPADSDFTAQTGSALQYMQLATTTSNFSADKTILGATSQAQAYVVDADSDTVWYVQSEDTGFTPFQDGEAVSETDGSGSGTISTAQNFGAVKRSSGEVVYIDNRAAITRSADQAEDIKIIIQL